jgi:hypothetical protein
LCILAINRYASPDGKHLAKKAYRPTWLDLAHEGLDKADIAGCGWKPDLSTEKILGRLLSLNLKGIRSQGMNQRNKPKFVILSGDKVHWLVRKHRFIFASGRDYHRFSIIWFTRSKRIRNEDGERNDFAGGR